VIGWFRGRMEFGARALGNRSILADPSQPGIAQRINRLVKFRESWRPFSASLLESAADDYIDRGSLRSHDEAMALSVKSTPQFRESYPDIVHVDGTARLQVVRENSNADFYSLLSQFAEATGQRLLINTALNRPGEALVCTPEDALNAFHGTDLNYLILGDLLVSKREEVDDW
jgi:carbamoyltransferase